MGHDVGREFLTHRDSINNLGAWEQEELLVVSSASRGSLLESLVGTSNKQAQRTTDVTPTYTTATEFATYPPTRPSGKSGLCSEIVFRPRIRRMRMGPAYEQLRKMVQLEM